MIGRIMITKSGHGGVELVKKYCLNFCVLLYRQCDKVLFLRESNLMKRGSLIPEISSFCRKHITPKNVSDVAPLFFT